MIRWTTAAGNRRGHTLNHLAEAELLLFAQGTLCIRRLAAVSKRDRRFQQIHSFLITHLRAMALDGMQGNLPSPGWGGKPSAAFFCEKDRSNRFNQLAVFYSLQFEIRQMNISRHSVYPGRGRWTRVITRAMMLLTNSAPRGRRAFTLPEVVVAGAIMTVVFAGMVTSYTESSRRAEWSGHSLAAHALALQQLEQARSAKWDILVTPEVNEITNLARVTSAVLDLPISGTNVVRATNYATVSTVAISTTPLVRVHLVEVKTVWPFRGRLYTNRIADYFAPD